MDVQFSLDVGVNMLLLEMLKPGGPFISWIASGRNFSFSPPHYKLALAKIARISGSNKAAENALGNVKGGLETYEKAILQRFRSWFGTNPIEWLLGFNQPTLRDQARQVWEQAAFGNYKGIGKDFEVFFGGKVERKGLVFRGTEYLFSHAAFLQTEMPGFELHGGNTVFTPAQGRARRVSAMYGAGIFPYYSISTDNFQLVALPVKGTSEVLTRLVISVSSPENIPYIVADIATGKLYEWCNSLVSRPVELVLPHRFQIPVTPLQISPTVPNVFSGGKSRLPLFETTFFACSEFGIPGGNVGDVDSGQAAFVSGMQPHIDMLVSGKGEIVVFNVTWKVE